MNFRTIFSILIIAVVFILGGTTAPPAQAQEATFSDVQKSMDTVLAQGSVKGLLATLVRPELATMTNFYLVDTLQTENHLATLGTITGYEINNADWLNEVAYQVNATLQPGSRELTLNVGKHNNRWLVDKIDLAAEVAPTVSTGATDATFAAGNGYGKIVFQTQSGGEIYVINVDGANLQYVTHGLDPQLSPDGAKIVFTRWEPRYELFTINIDGTDEQAWTHGWRQMKSPTWSADGSKIVFSYQGGGRLDEEEIRINVVNAALKGEEVRIPSECVEIEREGKYIKCRLPADAYWHLMEIDLITGEFDYLGAEQYSYGPTGHPTEPDIFIHKGELGLTLHNTQTGVNQPLTADFRDHTPVISPDGSKIAISYWQDGHWEIHTMNIDSSNRQRLTETPLPVLADNMLLVSEFVAGKERFVAPENPHWNNAAPVWSPDGSRIAFVTDRTGKWEIWIMNADGSNQRPMFPNGVLDGLTFKYAGVDERMLSWQ